MYFWGNETRLGIRPSPLQAELRPIACAKYNGSYFGADGFRKFLMGVCASILGEEAAHNK
jgi:hypothetical protein